MAELQGTAKACPHCGATMFMGTKTVPIVFEVLDNNGTTEYNIMKESHKDIQYEVFKCAHCRKDITKDDLVKGVKCNECGRVVSSNDVDENGVCDVCRAKKERAELANASTDELIHMLLKLEAQQSKSVKHAQEAMNPPEPAPEPEKKEEQAVQEEKKPAKRKRKVKKAAAADTAEPAAEAPETVPVPEPPEAEEPQPEQVQQEEVQQATEDIAQSQEAPFPNTDALSLFDQPVQPSNPVQDANNANGFQMFNNEEPVF